MLAKFREFSCHRTHFVRQALSRPRKLDHQGVRFNKQGKCLTNKSTKYGENTWIWVLSSSSSLPCILFIPWSVICSLLGSLTVDNFKPLDLSSEQITNNFSTTVHRKLQCC